MNRYSIGFKKRVQEADQDKLGVHYALIFIEKGISVAQVAEAIDVTRMTVYNWFLGRTEPDDSQMAIMEFMIKEHDKNR